MSLRSSLFYSYSLLIALLLVLFSIGATAALLRNPLVYENAAQQLRSAQRMLNNRAVDLPFISAERAGDLVREGERRLGVRVLLLKTDGTQLADSQSGSLSPLYTPGRRVRAMQQSNEIGFVRDGSNQLWLALVEPFNDGHMLLMSVRRPRLAIWEFFRSEFLRPIMLTGLIGLGLSILIAFVMAQWISAPLKRIGEAAVRVASGEFQPIRPDGPKEARSLAEAFNNMVQRVQDAQQSQRDLVANVSHELKTPLTSIQGFAQSILDGVSQKPEAIQRAAMIIQTEANRMQRLVQDLVVLARLEGGMVEMQCELVNLSALLRATVEKFRLQASEARIQLDVDVPEETWVEGDADRFVQVFSNLVDNAVKYTPAEGVVKMRAQVRDGNVQVQVADNGVGIEPADRERIFERFYRADRDRSRAGMGLGLAITRQIVLAHGGSIRVDPNQPHGAVFTVNFPLITEK